MATATKKKSKKSARRPAARSAPKKAASKAKAPKASGAPTHPGGPGTFCWNELMTSDVAGAKAF
jgi:hypothetical protein